MAAIIRASTPYGAQARPLHRASASARSKVSRAGPSSPWSNIRLARLNVLRISAATSPAACAAVMVYSRACREPSGSPVRRSR